MSHQTNATDVERNAVDKEKGSPDKSESLKRSSSEVSRLQLLCSYKSLRYICFFF